MNKLLAELAPRDSVLFYFLARTGLRIGEALGLKWRDLKSTPAGLVLVIDRQAQDGELEDEGKTENALRTVAILPSLARVLTRFRASAEYAGPNDPIFASLTGSHQDAHNVRRRLRPAAKEAGVEWATPHVFRHTLATELRDGGVHDTIIARVLGHADPNFTRRVYMHTEDAPRFDELDDGFTIELGGLAEAGGEGNL